MLINLRYGGTLSIPSEKYLLMSDEDIDKLELYCKGAEINDPFFASVLLNKQEKDEVEEEDLDVAIEDIIEEDQKEE